MSLSQTALSASAFVWTGFGISYLAFPDALMKNFITDSVGRPDARYLLRLAGVACTALGLAVGIISSISSDRKGDRTVVSNGHKILLFASAGFAGVISSHNVLDPFWKTFFIATNVARTLLHGYFGFFY